MLTRLWDFKGLCLYVRRTLIALRCVCVFLSSSSVWPFSFQRKMFDFMFDFLIIHGINVNTSQILKERKRENQDLMNKAWHNSSFGLLHHVCVCCISCIAQSVWGCQGGAGCAGGGASEGSLRTKSPKTMMATRSWFIKTIILPSRKSILLTAPFSLKRLERGENILFFL